jgi:hypothetical protein
MIYLASRSHPKYLAKLREVAARQDSYHIVTIAGGLAFLHALNSRTRSLAVVDTDPDVIHYASWMVELLRICSQRWEFFEVLSGHTTDRAAAGRVSFTDQRSDTRARLFQPDALKEIYVQLEQLYPVEQFDPVRQVLISPVGTVHFDGVTLDPMHFNWMNGFGAFESETTYAEMRRALVRLQPTFHTMALEDFDFSRCEDSTLVLASNTDSPLFTTKDPVLRAIERVAGKSVFYISRTRDTSVRQNGASEPLAICTLTKPAVAVNVSESIRGEIAKLFPQSWNAISISRYLESQLYDEECVLFWFEGENDTESRELLSALFSVNPIHQRVVVAAPAESEIHERMEQVLVRYKRAEQVRLGNYRLVVFGLRYGVPY